MEEGVHKRYQTKPTQTLFSPTIQFLHPNVLFFLGRVLVSVSMCFFFSFFLFCFLASNLISPSSNKPMPNHENPNITQPTSQISTYSFLLNPKSKPANREQERKHFFFSSFFFSFFSIINTIVITHSLTHSHPIVQTVQFLFFSFLFYFLTETKHFPLCSDR